jgi:hypothetical protein
MILRLHYYLLAKIKRFCETTKKSGKNITAGLAIRNLIANFAN